MGANGTGTSSASLELGHYYDAEGIVGKKNPAGKTYANPVSDASTEVLAAAGFYHAYFKSGDNNSIVYTTTPVGGAYETHGSFQIKVKMHDFTTETSASTSKPALGTAAYWKDTSEEGDAQYKYVDENGNVWTQDSATTEVDGMTATWALAQNSSRAMFYGADDDTPVNADPTSEGAVSVAAGTVTKSLDTISKTNAITVGYFGLYVDGEGNTNNRDGEPVSGNFIVTVTKNA